MMLGKNVKWQKSRSECCNITKFLWASIIVSVRLTLASMQFSLLTRKMAGNGNEPKT